jgi:hypothetical protein
MSRDEPILRSFLFAYSKISIPIFDWIDASSQMIDQ